MRILALLVLFNCLPGLLTAEEKPAIYVKVTWDIPWSTFCYLGNLFKDKLSDELLEVKGILVYRVKPSRIRYVNFVSECRENDNDDDARVEFYVSKTADSLSHSVVDKNMTYRAYSILFDYWRNKKMILMDEVFQGKVEEVALMGKDRPDISKSLTDEDRVGIGVGVGLVIAFLIAAIYLIMAAKRKKRKPVHGVQLNVIPNPSAFTRTENPTQDRWEETGNERRNKSDNGSAVYNMAYHDEPLDSVML